MMMSFIKKYYKLIIGILALIILSFFIFKKYFSGTGESIEVETIKIEKGSVTTAVTATGTVEPVDQVEVGTQVSGIINKIYVDFNSVVTKGQLLAELDKTNLNEAVANASASYEGALNERNYYQQNYNRQLKMYNSEVISKAAIEEAKYQLENARFNVNQKQTALSQARTNLGYTYIYSPIDGVILTKDVDEGQTVAASMTTPTLFTIAKDITKMQVEAAVDEADIGEVEVGQRVTFTVDAYPELEFKGRVNQVRLGAIVTSNVVTYTVIIEADNSEQKLKPGLTATITIYTNELTDATVVGARALNFVPEQELVEQYYKQKEIESAKLSEVKIAKGDIKYVWMFDSKGRLQQKEIKTGVNDGINIQVVSGLKTGDVVITDMALVKASEVKESEGASPFMPKMPSRNKKAQ